MSVYKDAACSSILEPGIAVYSDGPICLDVPIGAPLGSKSMTKPLYTPGSCQPSGGEPAGTAMPTNPSTLCCAGPP